MKAAIELAPDPGISNRGFAPYSSPGRGIKGCWSFSDTTISDGVTSAFVFLAKDFSFSATNLHRRDIGQSAAVGLNALRNIGDLTRLTSEN